MNLPALSYMIRVLKRYRFNVSELGPDQTVSGQQGFTSTRDHLITLNYDGRLLLNNEPVLVPRGPTTESEFEIDSPDDLRWFQDHIDMICTSIAEKLMAGTQE